MDGLLAKAQCKMIELDEVYLLDISKNEFIACHFRKYRSKFL
uniref:Uncharacterized protein n=1 Tax=Rhizophora mucronata TaxID=61149 RepID=A0A2P2N0X0_RHIMU